MSRFSVWFYDDDCKEYAIYPRTIIHINLLDKCSRKTVLKEQTFITIMNQIAQVT